MSKSKSVACEDRLIVLVFLTRYRVLKARYHHV